MSLQSVRWCGGVSLQLIRLVNANDLIGCGWGPLTNENHAWRCVEGCASLFVLGYHWLPIATIDLVGDNREFEV